MGTRACCCLGNSRRMRVGAPIRSQAKHRHQLHWPSAFNSGTLSVTKCQKVRETYDIVKLILPYFLHNRYFYPWSGGRRVELFLLAASWHEYRALFEAFIVRLR